MGGRGASSGKSGGGSTLAGLKVDLQYANMKASEYARKAELTSATSETRKLYNEWDKEAKRLQNQISEIENSLPKPAGQVYTKVMGGRNGQKVDYYNSVPNGYTPIKNAQTAPNGFTWYSNGKSRFGGQYKQVLVKNRKRTSKLKTNKQTGQMSFF